VGHDVTLIIGDHGHIRLEARGLLAYRHILATVEEIARREFW
jgi:hypothetical protein